MMRKVDPYAAKGTEKLIKESSIKVRDAHLDLEKGPLIKFNLSSRWSVIEFIGE
jgi:hypothetical protein